MNRTTTRINELKPDEVLEMFRLKAGGMTDIDISKKMKLSQAGVSRVLCRKLYADVPVGKALQEAVAKTRKASLKRSSRKKSNGADRSTAISKFTAACYDLGDAERECIRMGVDREVLSTILHTATGEKHL